MLFIFFFLLRHNSYLFSFATQGLKIWFYDTNCKAVRSRSCAVLLFIYFQHVVKHWQSYCSFCFSFTPVQLPNGFCV